MIRPLLATLLLSAAPAWAEAPAVLADTAPVQSLVAMVMGDLGTPGLIVAPGTSPHEASLTPSEAQALTEADVIVWTGDALLPWLGDSIASLAPEARVLALLDTKGWGPLPALGGDGIDPHAWLDPDVAVSWIGHISSALAEADPENAETYRQNAVDASEAIVSLKFALQDRLARFSRSGFIVGHDAYGYFSRAMHIPRASALAATDGAEPTPSVIAGLHDRVAAGEVQCLLLDPETNPAWADTLGAGATLRTAQVDPEGVRLEPGPSLYPTLLRNLADALESCLQA